MKSLFLHSVFVSFLLSLSGCSSVQYYAQSIGGHLDVMGRVQPVDEVLEQPGLAEVTRDRLLIAQQARAFASEALKLPDNASYTGYADLERTYVVWNVVAAPALSVEPYRWCYPVVGCLAYQGWFAEADARKQAKHMAEQGFDVDVGGVAAYSTLGWFSDPLLNTMLRWDEASLAGLIFHELAHQRLYIPGDTAFNEAFAVAVERQGLRRWLQQRNDAAAWERWQRRQALREEVVSMLIQLREALAEIYKSGRTNGEKRQAKSALIRQARAEFDATIRERPALNPYRPWFDEDLNNASLALLAVYESRVPAFERMLREEGGDWLAFYSRVEALGALPKEVRNKALDRLMSSGYGGTAKVPTGPE